ncbi:MAG: ribosomal L7Ae/L30e/S12e/Gadd45 family protein [Desulfotomaculum sp.]|nr:ribosomal L7Ae/L30e/S12e/Gadd45 family protein [Desulfotomaculum sp.]
MVNYNHLDTASQKTVGLKQTLKAVEKNQVKIVYIAQNADQRVVQPVVEICKNKNIPVVQVESMKSLGRACSIDVECAVASVVEE